MYLVISVSKLGSSSVLHNFCWGWNVQSIFTRMIGTSAGIAGPAREGRGVGPAPHMVSPAGYLDLFCGVSRLQELHNRLCLNEQVLSKILIESHSPKKVTWPNPGSVWKGTTQGHEFHEACPLRAPNVTISSSQSQSGCEEHFQKLRGCVPSRFGNQVAYAAPFLPWDDC